MCFSFSGNSIFLKIKKTVAVISYCESELNQCINEEGKAKHLDNYFFKLSILWLSV